MGSVPEDPATDRPREWLALPGGGIRPVVSVPGPGGIAELARFAASLGNVERVDVLPFHPLGAAKYSALGLDYPCAGVTPPSAAQVSRVRAAFTDAGLLAV